jgi:hypothetical protein
MTHLEADIVLGNRYGMEVSGWKRECGRKTYSMHSDLLRDAVESWLETALNRDACLIRKTTCVLI